MKISELLPSAEEWKQLRDIESTLLRRRTVGTLAGIVAIGSAALQLVLPIADKGYFDKLARVLDSLRTRRFDDLASIGFDRKAVVAWAVLLAAAVVYLLLRRSSVLLKESKEAFRYTFWINPFTEVEKTPGDRFKLESSDRFALLDHDLTERLDQRIKRFSVLKEAGTRELEDPAPSGASSRKYSSHIHISGHYALREEGNSDNSEWVVHLMPLVRIGPPGSPATVAQPVKYPLTLTDASTRQHNLEANEYRQIVERVYSSIATEVYKRIESDVREKIALFPTARLRAVALYHEAEDFARSNTVDAYERALSLYRDALGYFDSDPLDSSAQRPLVKATKKAARAISYCIWRPVRSMRRLVSRAGYDQEWARVAAGYAKCLVYRRVVSALTGRQRNPLYEIPELLFQPTAALERRYKPVGKGNSKPKLARLLASLHVRRAWWLPRGTHRERFEARKNALFELYLVSALALHFLERREQSLERLADAAATAPDRTAKDPLYLVALGLVESVVDKAILYHRQAVDIAPDFQIAQWFLAKACEGLFRRQDEITQDRAKPILQEYERALTINYGNISALSALGYLRWMVRAPRARECLEEGRQGKAIASETFVGELTYRLARVAAESGEFEECRNLYVEATSADPEVGAVSHDPEGKVHGEDFDDIGLSMLRRFEQYREDVERLIDQERDFVGPPAPTRELVGEQTLRIVHAFVLNDYGNACLRYFHYHGERSPLLRAIDAYRRATIMNPTDARPWFNLQYAYGWARESEKTEECYRRARQLAPTWTSVAIDMEKYRVVQLANRLPEEEREKDLEAQLKQARKDLSELLPRGAALTEGRSETSSGGSVPARSAISDAASPSIIAVKSGQGRPLAELVMPHSSISASSPKGEMELRVVLSGAPLAPALQSKQEQIKELERELERLKQQNKEFTKAVQRALDAIGGNSRLKPLFEGPIHEQVKRIVSIPCRRLDGRDVQTMIHFAEVLVVRGSRDELEAAEALAEHLLELTPDEYRVPEVLLKVVASLLQQGGEEESRRRLLERAKTQKQKIVKNWLEKDPRNFLSLYWYTQLWEETDDAAKRTGRLLKPEEIKENYFGEVAEEYECLRGWVAFDRTRYAEAAAAFSGVIELKPQVARHYLSLGQCREKLMDWENAYAAYSEAHRLDPSAREPIEGLASTLYQIGNRHFADVRFADAADNYAHAVELCPRNAEYHIGLALARERAELPDVKAGIGSAIEGVLKALELAPGEAGYRQQLNRLEARLAALECYGSTRTTNFVAAVSALYVWYGKDLESLAGGSASREAGNELENRYLSLRERIHAQYGVTLPDTRWSLSSALPANSFSIVFYGIPALTGTVDAKRKFCLITAEGLRRLGLAGTPARDPLGGGEGAWLGSEHWAAGQFAKLFGPLDYMLRHMEALLLSRLHDCLSYQDVANLLRDSEKLEIAKIADSREATGLLTQMLRALLAERAPISDYERLCHLFLERRAEKARPGQVIEEMRMLMRERLWGNSKDFQVVPAGLPFEDLLRASLIDTGTWRVLVIEPEIRQEMLATVRKASSGMPRPAVVVNDSALRVHVRKLIEPEFAHVPVLARRELVEGLRIAEGAIEVDPATTSRPRTAGAWEEPAVHTP